MLRITMPHHKTIVLADPVHGFTKIPSKIIQSLLESREVQRLRRIKQLGMGYLVFPAAEHSRFSHAFGAMGLLSNALDSLESKGTKILPKERLAAMAAVLLHDIGHGPYSHTLERKLIRDTGHEEIGKALIERLIQQSERLKRSERQMVESLNLAIQMFEGHYERSFFHDLISGQLDVDRLDYLSRDSHFTGVAEGRIGVDRILQTLCVYRDQGKEILAIEPKGVYAVENMLIARRLMYRQVYLHKTVIAADHVLQGAIRRARDLILEEKDRTVPGTSATLKWFLRENPGKDRLAEDQVLDHFLRLDDSDIIYSVKNWCTSKDEILADLSNRFIRRDLFRCKFEKRKSSGSLHENRKRGVTNFLGTNGITAPNAHSYYLIKDEAGPGKLRRDDKDICVWDRLEKSGKLEKLEYHTDERAIQALTKFEKKTYVCYPKEIDCL